MPINTIEFEKGSRDTGVLLLEFFRSNARVAYNPEELVKVLASMGRNLSAEEVERILLSLEYGGAVESKMIAGVPYYRYRKVLAFKPTRKPR